MPRHSYREHGYPLVQPLVVVDNSAFSPTGLTSMVDSPYPCFSKGASMGDGG
jgi:hypothetical protein